MQLVSCRRQGYSPNPAFFETKFALDRLSFQRRNCAGFQPSIIPQMMMMTMMIIIIIFITADEGLTPEQTIGIRIQNALEG